MEIQVRDKLPWTIIDLEGDFRGPEAQKFKDACADCLKENKTRLAANFKSVKFIDSTGMGAVIHCFQKAKLAEGKLVLVGLSDDIYDLFEMTSVDRLFTILDSEEELDGEL